VVRNEGHGGLAAEVHVGLVHHHGGPGVGVEEGPELVQVQPAAGGRVGVGEDDAAVGAPVVVHADAEGIIQGHPLVADAVEGAVDGVEAVGDVREEQGAVVLEQGQEGQGQHLVGAVAHEHLPGLEAVPGGDGLPEAGGGGVGVEPETVRGRFPDGLQGPGGGPIGVLVGIELHQVLQPGLLTGDIGGEGVDDLAPESAHGTPGGRSSLAEGARERGKCAPPVAIARVGSNCGRKNHRRPGIRESFSPN